MRHKDYNVCLRSDNVIIEGMELEEMLWRGNTYMMDNVCAQGNYKCLTLLHVIIKY